MIAGRKYWKKRRKYILDNGGSITIFEFDFGMDFDENCPYRDRRSLTKVDN